MTWREDMEDHNNDIRDSMIPSRLRSSIFPEDVLQDTWCAVCRSAKKRKLPSGDYRNAWLRRVAVNCLLMAIRRRRANKRGGYIVNLGRTDPSCEELVLERGGSPDLDPSARMVAEETGEAVRLALTGLPPDHRLVMWLFHVEGMSYAAIADVMGREVPSIRGLLGRARRGFKARLLG